MVKYQSSSIHGTSWSLEGTANLHDVFGGGWQAGSYGVWRISGASYDSSFNYAPWKRRTIWRLVQVIGTNRQNIMQVCGLLIQVSWVEPQRMNRENINWTKKRVRLMLYTYQWRDKCHLKILKKSFVNPFLPASSPTIHARQLRLIKSNCHQFNWFPHDHHNMIWLNH